MGGSLLNKAGALLLVVGIALFLAYSFGHMTAAGRAAMALIVRIVGVVLAVAGGMIVHSLRYRSHATTAVAYFAAFAAIALTPSTPFALVRVRIATASSPPSGFRAAVRLNPQTVRIRPAESGAALSAVRSGSISYDGVD